MKIIKPSVEIISKINADEILRIIELAGRVCYKSEGKIGDGSAEKLIRSLLKRGHESVIEHFNVTVKFICDRGVTHEIVRHRVASYSQESTRYCNYAGDKFGNELIFIRPCFYSDENNNERFNVWKRAMQEAEINYFELISLGAPPEEARNILPNSLKTELVMTANMREWRHFFRLRADKAAHPQMQEIAKMLLAQFQKEIPLIFDEFL